MADIIGFFLVLAALILFPYRKMYHRLNRILDAKTLLGGIAFISLRFIWGALIPEEATTSSVTPADDLDFVGRLNVQISSLAEVIGWIFVMVGIGMVCITIWKA